MEISPAIFEEMLEDTRRLVQSIVQYGDRWSKYGDSLKERMSESQLEELAELMEEVTNALDSVGGYD
jgi:heterodisulfide reductase subunit C